MFMTKREISEQLTNCKAEMDSLILKINALETSLQRINEEDVLGVYKSAINKQAYRLDKYGDIERPYGFKFDENSSHPYCNYPLYDYVEQAQRIKDFNDKLLAFKWCYDRDYEPDWENEDEKKYYIYYDNDNNHYDWDWNTLYDNSAIYFSTREIAQKCADWLNSLSE